MNGLLVMVFIGSGVLGAVVGFLLNRSIARAVMSSQQLDTPLYNRWGSPKADGGIFIIRQQDQGKLLWATYQIIFNSPKRLTQSVELQSSLKRIRRYVLWWNIIGIPILIVYLWFWLQF